VSNTTVPTLRTFADAERVLASKLPHYTERPAQQRLAKLIEDSIADGAHVVAEAGTGCGKSYATLIPAILSGQRVVFSTATKVLQNQVFDLDLPMLANHLVPFSFALLKGRSTYACGGHLLSAKSDKAPNAARVREVLAEGVRTEGFTGTREEIEAALGDKLSHAEWAEYASESQECSAFKCRSHGAQDTSELRCWAAVARDLAADAQVVVVNHALLCTDLVVRQQSEDAFSLLGEYDLVIVDELHQLDNYATNALTTTFSERSISAVISRVRNFAAEFDVLDHVDDQISSVEAATIDLWDRLAKDPNLRNKRLTEAVFNSQADGFVDLSRALTALHEATIDLGPRVRLVDDAERRRFSQVKSRVTGVARRFHEYCSADFTGPTALVRSTEEQMTRRREKYLALKAEPVSSAPFLAEWLWDRTPVVGVSATITVAGSFQFIIDKLGIPNPRTLIAGSAFDYPRQARLYVPRRIAEPAGRTRNQWSAQALLEMRELIKLSGGRALVLFTAVSDMNATYDTLSATLPYTCLKQGDASPPELVARFKADVTSVLFATKSFFEGVDIPGEALSLVIVSKLPFGVPTIPLTEARVEAIERRGGNAFNDYTVPEMVLPLQQACGRLIRHAKDRGVMAVLDPRLLTKGYGKRTLKSLPDATLVTELADVERFFEGAA
jgi:ATP-dependent DNA helicase DinG